MIGSLVTDTGEFYVSRIDFIDFLQESTEQFPRGYPQAIADWFVRTLTSFGECNINLDGNAACLEIDITDEEHIKLDAIVEEELGTFFKVDDVVEMLNRQRSFIKEQHNRSEWKAIDEAVEGFCVLMSDFVKESKKQMGI